MKCCELIDTCRLTWIYQSRGFGRAGIETGVLMDVPFRPVYTWVSCYVLPTNPQMLIY